MEEDIDLKRVDELIAPFPLQQSSLLPMLQRVQDEFRYLPRQALLRVSQSLKVPFSQVFRVATFYNAFSLTPRGRFEINVCMGTSCHVRGAPKVLEQFERILGVKPGETTRDRLFSLETVNCVGACALSPVVVIGEDYHRGMTPARVKPLLESYRKRADKRRGVDVPF